MTVVSVLGIILACSGVYFLIAARNILLGLVCLIAGLAILGGGITLIHK